jgi:hypothetical protein
MTAVSIRAMWDQSYDRKLRKGWKLHEFERQPTGMYWDKFLPHCTHIEEEAKEAVIHYRSLGYYAHVVMGYKRALGTYQIYSVVYYRKPTENERN